VKTTALIILITVCGLMMQQLVESHAKAKRDKIECKKCHYCSQSYAKRVCSDYKMGV